MKYLVFIFLNMIVFFTYSCDSNRSVKFSKIGYQKAVISGLKQIPEASQIDDIFGKENVDHFISYSGDLENGCRWSSEVFFAEKYILTMQVPVRMGRSFDKVLEVQGEPKFYLNEVDSIEKKNKGYIGNLNSTFKWSEPFGVKKWKRIYEAGGDFSAAAITLKLNQPVKYFSQYQSQWRRDRIKIHQ